MFNDANKLVQREEPLIHVLQQQLYGLLKKVLGNFVKPSVLVEAIQKEALLALDFHDLNNQVHDCDLVIGIVTKQTLFGLALTTGWQKPFPLLSTQFVDTALCLLTSTWTSSMNNISHTNY